MTSEFKETFSKSPSQNDSSTHDSLKLMPNLNTMPKRLSVHLFSFSLLLLHVLHLSSSCKRVFCYVGLKSELVNILDAIYESDTWLDLLVYFVYWCTDTIMSLSTSWYILSLKHVITEWNSISASEHICLHNSKDRGILLKTVGGLWGLFRATLPCISLNYVLFFPLYFRPDTELITLFCAILIKCRHVDAFS